MKTIREIFDALKAKGFQRKVATTVTTNWETYLVVRLYRQDVFEINKGVLILRPYPYFSNTTKRRINDALEAAKIPLRVCSVKGAAYVYNFLPDSKPIKVDKRDYALDLQAAYNGEIVCC